MPVATMPMPRKNKSEKPDEPTTTPRKTAPVQIETDLARWANMVATHDGVSVSQLISPYLRPFLLEHYKRVRAEMDEELDGAS